MSEHIRGSVGRAFDIGKTHLYAGPGLKGHKLPILAVKRPEDAKEIIVADFKNSTSAERFIQALMKAIDEATIPELTPAELAEVKRFGIHEEDC
jgi:hypothetical protein